MGRAFGECAGVMLTYNPKGIPRKGEIRLKQWVAEEAMRNVVSTSAIWNRIYRGWYRDLKLRRAGTRTIFVKL